jgi:hypothetical protein
VLLTSLTVSIVAAAVMMVDAECGANSAKETRRKYREYFGYLPLSGTRRHLLQLAMMFFTGGYLVLATSTVAVATSLFPLTAVLGVLAVDCAIYHLSRMAAGEWWVLADDARTGMGAWTADFVMNTVFWMMCHVCPWPTVRDSNWIGPPVMARTIAEQAR